MSTERTHPNGRTRPKSGALKSAAHVAAGAAILLLPALVAGRPFIYWDTPTFYGWGHDILAAVREPWPPLSDFPAHRGLWAADNMPGAWDKITPERFQLALTSVGARSSFYAVPLYLLGSTLTLWAPAAVQALLVAWLVRVALDAALPPRNALRRFDPSGEALASPHDPPLPPVGRTPGVPGPSGRIAPRSRRWDGWLRDGAPPLVYLGLIAALTAATTASFFAAFLMPDVFAALAVLATGLLLCFPDRLTRGRTIGCAVLVAAGVLVHLSVVPAVAGLFVFGVAAVRAIAPAVPVRRGAIPVAAALVCAGAAAGAAGLGLEAIFGQDVRSPPFVQGRVIADGPGQQFLREVCERRPFAACLYKDLVVRHTDDIIWPDVTWNGLPLITDPAERRRYLDEQPAVVLGTLLNHPFAQLRASALNAARLLQSVTFSSDILTSFVGLLRAGTDRTMRVVQIVPGIERCLPDGGASCDPAPFLEAWHTPLCIAVAAAAMLLAACTAAWLRPRRADPASDHRRRLAAFAVVVVAGVVLNGIVCGVLSGPWARYQARVIWLVPLVAALMAGELLRPFAGGRGAASGVPRAAPDAAPVARDDLPHEATRV